MRFRDTTSRFCCVPMFVVLLMVSLSLVMSSCIGDGEVDQPAPYDPEQSIGFGLYLGQQADTRITDQQLGIINNVTIRQSGFGVYAYYTDVDAWDDAPKPLKPDFMRNQHIIYDEGWTYTPLHYWPNAYFHATDDIKKRLVSFYAYAPYATLTESSDYLHVDGYGVNNELTGIVGIELNATDGTPEVIYRLANEGITTLELPDQVDLLYADPVKDDHKYNTTKINEDLTPDDLLVGDQSDVVKFNFHHALSCVDIYVRRDYEDGYYSYNHLWEDTLTKVFVNEFELKATSGEVITEGRLNLNTHQWKSNHSDKSGNFSFRYHASGITSAMRGADVDELNKAPLDSIIKWEAENWDEHPGVTRDMSGMSKNGFITVVIPNNSGASDAITFTPRIKYSFMTQDDELVTSQIVDSEGHHYARIPNDVSGSPFTIGDVQMGKRYKVLCRIGVSRISCEVVDVEEWEFPIIMGPTVTDTDKDPRSLILDE